MQNSEAIKSFNFIKNGNKICLLHSLLNIDKPQEMQ
jgi:hypothetical protein